MKIGNWPLMMMVIEYVIKHPTEYDQSVWRRFIDKRDPKTDEISVCGSVRCIAGWSAAFGGWQDVPGSLEWLTLIGPGGIELRQASTEEAALDSLGVDLEYRDRVATDLFDGDLTFQDVLERVLEYANADGVTLTPAILAEAERLRVRFPDRARDDYEEERI